MYCTNYWRHLKEGEGEFLDTSRTTEDKMAEKSDSFLNCHICSETFRDPVSLGCHHSFCSSCLTKFWDQAQNKNCPVCSKEFPDINFSLKDLADSIAGRHKAGSSEERRGEGVEVVCSKHSDEPKWFCEEEQRAVCHVCEVPDEHDHKVVPLEEAVNSLKEKLKNDLQFLQDKQDKHKHVEETYQEVMQHSKKQLVATETQIRDQFKKLHQFLKAEEEARLAAVREEEEEKRKTISREMKKTEAQISSLSVSISAMEQQLQKQKVSFLSSYKHTQSSTRAQVTLPDPQLVSGALIDVAKHLGNLTFRVWEKMRGVVSFSPVILDPNTASPWLSLSDDLTSVRQSGPMRKLPDNAERNNNYVTVLGSEGYSSGKHSWEVEVGDHPYWYIGVARESVDRKGACLVSPKSGFWCIGLLSGEYEVGGGGTLPLKRRPQRISVQLDWNRGEVSFYDPEDMTHIHTQKDFFTEKLYPYLSIGGDDNARHPDVKICQSEVSVSVMSSQ